MGVTMKILFAAALMSVASYAVCSENGPSSLSLTEAVSQALARDPWLESSQLRQQALLDEAEASGSLPDPTLSLMAGNLPVDSFDLGQEPMTQLSVGLSQMFPRGDTLSLAKQKRQQLALEHPLLREDRRAKAKAIVSRLWLDAFNAQESIRLIERDRALFEHLVDAARAGYSAAVAGAQQQDVIRAQLELTRLEDRLTVLKRRREAAQRRLSEWVGAPARRDMTALLPLQAPDRPVSTGDSDQARYESVQNHPQLLALDVRIDATETDVELARQRYKPEWGLSARYGYRHEDPQGRSRADLFSVGITFDLPLFTAARQDKQVSASLNRAGAIKTDRELVVRRLVAELETATVDLARLDQRHELYTDQLLPQMAEQAKAALAAYNNDDGDFAEAVRARIAELNARIESLDIAVARQKTIAQINYLLVDASPVASASLRDF
jgi:outer membrane protein TolC